MQPLEPNPRVTWIMPVKNGLPYLPHTLASIQAQTYKNWEVLIWDNGSEDGTVELLRKWVPEKLPGRVVTGKPLGLAESLAEMVELAETELVARIDADDISKAHRLQDQVAFMVKNPDLAALGSQCDEIDEAGVNFGIRWPLPVSRVDVLHTLGYMNPMCHPSMLLRRSAVLEVGNYRPIRYVEDWDLWMRVAARHRIENFSEPLVLYRIHAQSVTRKAQQAAILEDAEHRIIADNAPALFGVDSETMLKLVRGEYPDPTAVLFQIAGHLKKTQPCDPSPMRTGSFLALARKYLPENDPATWRRFLLQGGRYDLAAKAVLRKVVKRAPARSGGHEPTALDPKSAWIQGAMKGKRCAISEDIEFLGQPAFDYIELGEGVHIEAACSIWLSADAGAEARLQIGDYAWIDRGCVLRVYQPVEIGAHAQIGPYCTLLSGVRDLKSRSLPPAQQGFKGGPVTVGPDAVLESHVTLLPGARIGRGAVIQAGSVVGCEVPDFEIWAGNPASKIGARP